MIHSSFRKTQPAFRSVSRLLAILCLQSPRSCSHSLSLAFNSLSCNAIHGAVLNLLVLAGGPHNINKLRRNNGLSTVNEYPTRAVVHWKKQEDIHFNFCATCMERSVIIVFIPFIICPFVFPFLLSHCYLLIDYEQMFVNIKNKLIIKKS